MLELVSKSPDPESQNVWSQIPPLTTNHVRWSSQFWCASVYLLYPPPRCVKRTHLDTLIIRTTGSTWGLLGKFLFLFPVSLYCVFLWADILTFSLVLFLSRCHDSGRSLICSFKRAPLCRRTQKQKVCVCVGGHVRLYCGSPHFKHSNVLPNKEGMFWQQCGRHFLVRERYRMHLPKPGW